MKKQEDDLDSTWLQNNTKALYLIGLALLATLSSILLTGVSVWFLGAVALAGAGPLAFTFNFHHPAAFIRLLAFSRTLAKYGERLLGHDMALDAQTRRRDHLFNAIVHAPETRARSWQLGQEHHLTDFMDDVTHLDFAPLRTDLPMLGLGFGVVFALVVASIFVSYLLGVILLGTLGILAFLLMRFQHDIWQSWAQIHSITRALSEELGQTFATFTALAGSHQRGEQTKSLSMAMKRRRGLQEQLDKELAWVDTIVASLGPAFAMLTMTASWMAGARGETLLPAIGIAFLWIALGEIATNAASIMLGAVQRKTAQQTLSQWDGTSALVRESINGTHPAIPISQISLQKFSLMSPDHRILGQLNLTIKAGLPVAIVGASGSGKTSLLKPLAGWVGATEGIFCNGIKVDQYFLRDNGCFIQHDAAILNGTIRENLFASHASDDELWQALDMVELGDRIRSAGNLDTLVSGNATFSQGEAHRLSLARAFLSQKPILLIDEPGEHLDSDQARRIITRLLAQKQDQIVILTTHQAELFKDQATMLIHALD